MLAGLLALATTFGALTSPVGPLRYKIEMKSSQEVDLSAMGAGKQSGDLSITAFVSMTMSDSGAGQLAHVVVDSMAVTPTGMMAQQMDPSLGASAKGGFFHLYVINGKVEGTPKPSDAANLALSTLGQAVTALFPGTTKPGLKAGESFVDTANVSAIDAQGTRSNVTITNWSLKSMQGDAMMLDGVTSGKMTIDGGANAISGTVKGTRSMTSTRKGPVTLANITNNSELAVVPAGMSDAIPVTGISTVTITLLP